MQWPTRLLAVLLVVTVARPACLAEELPDVIPADALIAIGVRNVEQLRKKGDDFLDAAGPDYKEARVSTLVTFVYQYLGIKGGVDETRPVVLCAVRSPKEKVNEYPKEVLLVPFNDLDAIAGNFGFEKGKFKRDTLTPIKDASQGFTRFGWARGKHLILGDDPDAVQMVAQGKAAGTLMTPAQRRNLEAGDLMLFVGTESWGNDWKTYLKEVKDRIKPRGPLEEHVTQQFLDALGCCHYAAVGCRVEKDGLFLNLLFGLPQNPPADVSAFLKTLGPTAGPATMRGLPEERVMAALATSADGAETAVLTRLFLKTVFQNTPLTSELFLDADQPVVAAVSANIWGHVRSRRLALYSNPENKGPGLYSMVAILDTDDPKKFIQEVGKMARYASGKDLDLSDATGKENVLAVEKLIRDLGSEDFATRESASVQLGLIGEPALPFVQKAAASSIPEVRRRAELLLTEIKERAEARRQELKKPEGARRFRPGFELTPAAEMLDGQPVDILSVKLARQDDKAVGQMREWFGPDWARVRMVTVDKRVVVLYGSDLELLRRTTANLRTEKPGLAAEPGLKGFQRMAERDRSLELHFSMESFLAMTRPNGKEWKRVPGQFTSIAVGADPGRYEVQMWVPAKQFGALLKVFFPIL